VRKNGKRIIGQATVAASLAMLLLMTACSKGTIGEPSCTTGVLLYVNSSDPSVRSVVLNARNIAYDEDTISKWFREDRNIQQEPLIVLIKPSSTIGVDDPFLVRAWGYDSDSVQIVAGARVIRFDPPHCQAEREIVMRGTFIDADRDGFQPCAGAPDGTCDCNDQNTRINPLTEESCGDNTDNNCDSQTNEGCT